MNEKQSEIEGVTQARLDRLWKHLLKVEELTGGKLRRTPRDCSCPISGFAPIKDGQGRHFDSAGFILWYLRKKNEGGRFKHYDAVYSIEDGEWWSSLSFKTRQQITKWVIARIKERNDGLA